MPSSKVTTTIMGILAVLFSPVLLACATVLFIIVGMLICPGITDKHVVGCENCESQVCPITLLILMFVALPLGIFCGYRLRKRKAHTP
jgi:hypothetical protein